MDHSHIIVNFMSLAKRCQVCQPWMLKNVCQQFFSGTKLCPNLNIKSKISIFKKFNVVNVITKACLKHQTLLFEPIF